MAAAATSSNFLARDLSFTRTGRHVVTARTADGTTTEAVYEVGAWQAARAGARPAKNIILLVGDGMGIAHRTAARIVSRGQTFGKTNGPLAMDTLGVTGLVMTSSLNATITDSAPGMSPYVTGHKANNNQVGVYPDNTPDVFDNPRVEYVGEVLRRTPRPRLQRRPGDDGRRSPTPPRPATPCTRRFATSGTTSPRACSTSAAPPACRC